MCEVCYVYVVIGDLVSVQRFGFHFALWSPCCIVCFRYRCAFQIALWSPCYSGVSHCLMVFKLQCGFSCCCMCVFLCSGVVFSLRFCLHVAMWSGCFSVISMLQCDLHADVWSPCCSVISMLQCGFHVAIWYSYCCKAPKLQLYIPVVIWCPIRDVLFVWQKRLCARVSVKQQSKLCQHISYVVI